MKPLRSPLSLNFIEILFASLVTVLAWLWLPAYFVGFKPYGPGVEIPAYAPPAVAAAIGDYAFPITAVMTLASISLVRAIFNDVRHFTRLGHLAMTTPLLSMTLIGCVSPCLDLLGLGLMVLALAQTIYNNKSRGNWCALYLLLWVFVDWQFTQRIWALND